MERESTEVKVTQKIWKKEETLTKKMKGSLNEMHTQTHGIEMYQRS